MKLECDQNIFYFVFKVCNTPAWSPKDEVPMKLTSLRKYIFSWITLVFHVSKIFFYYGLQNSAWKDGQIGEWVEQTRLSPRRPSKTKVNIDP